MSGLGLCDRPGCCAEARHQPHHGGTTFPGWRRLCCTHVDEFMRIAATTCTDPLDAATGLLSWAAAHADECGVRV